MIFYVLISKHICLHKKIVSFWSNVTGFYQFPFFTLLPRRRFYYRNQLLLQSLLHNTQGGKIALRREKHEAILTFTASVISLLMI